MWRRSRNLFSFTNTYLSNTDPHNIALFSLLCGASSPGKHGTLSSNYSLDYSNLHCFVFHLHKKSRGFLWQRKSEVIVATQVPEAHTTHLILNPYLSLLSLNSFHSWTFISTMLKIFHPLLVLYCSESNTNHKHLVTIELTLLYL